MGHTKKSIEDRVNHRSLILGTMTVAFAAIMSSTTAWADQARQPKSTAATKTNPATGEPAEVPAEPAPPEQPTEEKRPEKYDPETGKVEGTKFVFTPYGLGQGQVTRDSTQSFQH